MIQGLQNPWVTEDRVREIFHQMFKVGAVRRDALLAAADFPKPKEMLERAKKSIKSPARSRGRAGKPRAGPA